MRYISIISLLCILLAGCGTKNVDAPQQDALTTLDLESLNGDIDTQMDISKLSLSDLYILRHAFQARRGYPFEDSYLRHVYQTTTWYDSLMWAFDETEENFEWKKELQDGDYRDYYYGSIKDEAVPCTPEEKAFVERIKKREQELLAQNFKPSGGGRVNVDNLLNPGLMTTFDPQLKERLTQNGFAIVPARHQQLFQLYEKNDYHDFPNFVTTDLFLQLYHLYTDCMLREVEANKLDSLLTLFVRAMYFNCNEQAFKSSSQTVQKAARHNAVYFGIAHQLLTGKSLPLYADQAVADEEIAKVMNSENAVSNFIGEYQEVQFPYSLFRPRGHYTRSEQLERYFRAMMWLQAVPFGLDAPMQLEYALQMADVLKSYDENLRRYQLIDRVLTLLMGNPDNLTILQVADEMAKTGLTIEQLLDNKGEVEKLRQRLNQMGNAQTRIRPKFERTSHNKICLMPQRYQPDAEVLQEMVDYDSKKSKRVAPKGLDVLAAMGSTAAERILIDELGEANRWEGYKPNLQRMKQRMDSIDWQENAAVEWLDALKTVVDKADNVPYFMKTAEWDRKSLNTALASWAELKHDAILYAKQPMGAECGGAGPPDPVVKGYVEPNVRFWEKAISLLKSTAAVLRQCGMMTEKIANSNELMTEEAEFLLLISQKELNGEQIKSEEYDQLEYIGAKFENMSLDLLRDPDIDMWNWEAVQGPDRRIALVADVYTANADNNEDHKCVLYEAIGDADELYVVVEVGGYLHLMRGAVFSYREFDRPLDQQRLTDEEWQKYVDEHPREGVPTWMSPIIVPLEATPEDNDAVFYSSGC